MASNKDNDNHLLFDLSLCLEREIPVPPRISATFIDLVRKGYKGEFYSWDEAFGKPRMNPREREKSERRWNQAVLVADAVRRLQAEDGSLNEAAFEEIGRETGVGGKTKVKELLQEKRYSAEKLNGLLELGRNFLKNFRR
jgi:hypothetical protein